MDHATIATAISGIIGLGLGAGAHRLFVGDLKAGLAAKDKRIDSLRAEISTLGERFGGANRTIRDKDEAIAKLVERVEELEPDAALGRKHREQSQRALAKAQEANRQRNAAKAAGHVVQIKRKRA